MIKYCGVNRKMYEEWMREALSEAAKSGEDVPVGAVVVYQDRIIARAHNERENGG
ncbi:MAG: hypothetical protein II481_04310, partial [Clostridia bacterium]|nr:hypothetical protein [Clostridia bacterium]